MNTESEPGGRSVLKGAKRRAESEALKGLSVLKASDRREEAC